MRLLNSITGLLSDAADYAADRIDSAAENLRGENPDAIDWQARALDAEARLDELYLDENGSSWKSRALFAEARSTDYKRERDAMQVQLDIIAVALQAVDFPAPENTEVDVLGAHVDYVLKTLASRPTTASILEGRGAVLDAILANLREYGLDMAGSDYPEGVAMAVSAALRDRAAALHQLRATETALTLYDRGQSPISLAVDLSKVSGRVVGALHTLMHRLEQAEEQLDAVKRITDEVLHSTDAADHDDMALGTRLRLGVSLMAAQRNEANSRAAAARIRARADEVEREQVAYNGGPIVTDADIAGGEGYVAGMRAAADIAAGDTPEADPDVAHIDTINGRAEAADPTSESE